MGRSSARATGRPWSPSTCRRTSPCFCSSRPAPARRRPRARSPRPDLDHGSSVVRLNEMYGAHAIEHGTTRSGRWLRERRLRITLWIAAVEGLLYLFHALHWWAAVGLAIIAVAFWWYVGRANRSHTLRQLSWIFAASQL